MQPFARPFRPTGMSAGRVLLVAGVVALSVAGCQAGGTATPAASVSLSTSAGPSSATPVPTSAGGTLTSQPKHSTPPSATGAPPPTGPETPVPAAQVETAGVPTNPPGGVATAAGGRTVVFTVEQSGCQHVSGQVTGETPTSVAILVQTTVTAKPGQMCPMIVREVLVTVNLAAPLGSRKIVFSGVTKHG